MICIDKFILKTNVVDNAEIKGRKEKKNVRNKSLFDFLVDYYESFTSTRR